MVRVTSTLSGRDAYRPESSPLLAPGVAAGELADDVLDRVVGGLARAWGLGEDEAFRAEGVGGR
jgi:hypothetical protein